MNKTLLIILGLLVISGVGFAAYNTSSNVKSSETENKMMAEKDAMMQAEKDAMMNKDAMTDKTESSDSAMQKEDGSMMKKSTGMYTQYDESKIALAKDNKVIIFFHASWCPSCRTLDSELSSAKIKDGYVILKADYDSQKALKAKYGVTSQHTLVQVDAAGNQIAKWSGGDLSMIYSKAQ